jgi:hypothetical protein
MSRKSPTGKRTSAVGLNIRSSRAEPVYQRKVSLSMTGSKLKPLGRVRRHWRTGDCQNYDIYDTSNAGINRCLRQEIRFSCLSLGYTVQDNRGRVRYNLCHNESNRRADPHDYLCGSDRRPVGAIRQSPQSGLLRSPQCKPHLRACAGQRADETGNRVGLDCRLQSAVQRERLMPNRGRA